MFLDPMTQTEVYSNPLGAVAPPLASTSVVYRYTKVQCPGVPVRYVKSVLDRDAKPVRQGGGQVEVMARRVSSTMVLPRPSAGIALGVLPRDHVGGLAAGSPVVYVNAVTGFWTDPVVFSPRFDSTRLGGVWVQVMATPVALEFTPGPGVPVVSCPGPGVRFYPASVQDLLRVPQHDCWYRYRSSSVNQPDQMVSATWTIRWRITWVGSGDTAGELPMMTTSSTQRFAVIEAHTLTTR